MRLAACFASVAPAAVVAVAVSTWSTMARADEPASLQAPLNPSEAPAPPMAPESDPAAVQPPPPPYEAPPRETSHWYGGEILVVDGAALGGGVAVGLADPGAGSALFLGGYVLGGPIVHLAHHRPLAALGSFALRVAAPTLGALTGYSLVKVANGGVGDVYNDVGAFTLGGLGLILGYATAIAIDSAAIAREPLPSASNGDDAAKKNAPAPSSGFTWSPSLAPTHGGGVAGIVGRF